MSDNPSFERVPDHQFRAGEKIYMIDIENNYDIWEAEIISVKDDDKYKIHYPEYPDDDDTIEGTDHFLVRTDRNNKIFAAQEQIRLEGEKKENNNESEGDVDYVDEKKKKQNKNTKKSKKEKKEKKAKVPKPKKVKEPKPKKEKKPKKTKPSKRITNDKELALLKKKIVKEALKKNIKDSDGFIKFFDDEYRKDYGDKTMDKIFDKTLKIFEDRIKKASEQGQDDVVNEYSDEDDPQSEEEEEKEFEPEIIILPDVPKKLNECHEVQITNTVISFDKESPFSILFDSAGRCNCFIFKTPATKYLILNGMKFELEEKAESDAERKDRSFLYESLKLKSHENQQSSEYMYPSIVKSGQMKLKEPPESVTYVSNITKKKVRKIDNLPDQPITDKFSKSKQSNKNKANNNDRSIHDFVEDSD